MRYGRHRTLPYGLCCGLDTLLPAGSQIVDTVWVWRSAIEEVTPLHTLDFDEHGTRDEHGLAGSGYPCLDAGLCMWHFVGLWVTPCFTVQ